MVQREPSRKKNQPNAYFLQVASMLEQESRRLLVYEQAIKDMRDPSFTTSWRLVTAWGKRGHGEDKMISYTAQ